MVASWMPAEEEQFPNRAGSGTGVSPWLSAIIFKGKGVQDTPQSCVNKLPIQDILFEHAVYEDKWRCTRRS